MMGGGKPLDTGGTNDKKNNHACNKCIDLSELCPEPEFVGRRTRQMATGKTEI
jgi:hypothetical protein